MQQKYEFEQKAKEEAAELRRVQTRLLVPSNYHQGAELQKHVRLCGRGGEVHGFGTKHYSWPQ